MARAFRLHMIVIDIDAKIRIATNCVLVIQLRVITSSFVKNILGLAFCLSLESKYINCHENQPLKRPSKALETTTALKLLKWKERLILAARGAAVSDENVRLIVVKIPQPPITDALRPTLRKGKKRTVWPMSR